MTTHYDVVIIGAGPGGAAAALTLAQSGINFLLVDKATFPRDKICGDALSGKVTGLFSKLHIDLHPLLNAQPTANPCNGISFIAPAGHRLDLPLAARPNGLNAGYTMSRTEFDHFLIKQVVDRKVKLMQNTTVTQLEKNGSRYYISLLQDNHTIEISASLIINAEGERQHFSKEILSIAKNKKHFSAGLRQYYEGVNGFHSERYIELHFLKELSPGYFWIFPMADNKANVGLGMLSAAVKSKNLKALLANILKEHPAIAPRFANAQALESVKGWGLPLGSKLPTLVADNFMAIGDAGSLIDPFTGEGIGNAMWSGHKAALVAIKAIQHKTCSKENLVEYQHIVNRGLGAELKLSHRLQQLSNQHWLMNMVVKKASSNKELQQLMSSMFEQVDVRAKLSNPLFYLRLLRS